jgi:hypothetical protein
LIQNGTPERVCFPLQAADQRPVMRKVARLNKLNVHAVKLSSDLKRQRHPNGLGNMKLRLLPFVLAMPLLVASPAVGQTLWQNVDSGMTAAQVRQAQPTAATPAKVEKLASGATCNLAIDQLSIDGAPYNVCFYFLDERLVQIMMSASGSPSRGQYMGIVSLLRAKYGAELSSEKTVLGHETDWLLPSNVNISVVYFSEVGPLLNVVYQTRMADERDKL